MDPKKTSIAINGEFTAIELEEIIGNLAVVRAGMEPAVPLEPPCALSEQEIPAHDDVKFSMGKLVTGGLRIWLRSDGFGWLAFTLPPADVLGIREFLGKESRDGTAH